MLYWICLPSLSFIICLWWLNDYLCHFFRQMCSDDFESPYLEKTGIGQYLASSPKTWRKFLLKPRLKPFLSVPWRNTGERTASERTHMEPRSQCDRQMNKHNTPSQSRCHLLFRLLTGAHSDNTWRLPAEWNSSEWKCLCSKRKKADLGPFHHEWLLFLAVSVTKLLTALSHVSLHYTVTYSSG